MSGLIITGIISFNSKYMNTIESGELNIVYNSEFNFVYESENNQTLDFYLAATLLMQETSPPPCLSYR